MRSPRRSDLVALLILLSAVVPSRPARAVAFVQSIVQTCEEGNNCQTGTPVMVPGQQADMSRAWDFDGFHYAASAAIATDYVGWSAFARGSGLENPENPGSTTFINLVSRGGNAYGHIHDTITAGTGGGSGFLRLPLHFVGNTSVSWQNGFGATSFGVGCTSSVPNTATVIGNCATVFANFTANATIDQEVNLDIPIVLGSPAYFIASFSAAATAGHAYGDLIPFTGQTEITIATLPFEGAIVLDAGKQPIPGATVVSESGFVYQAPEASSLLGALAALASLGSLRRRRARRRRAVAMVVLPLLALSAPGLAHAEAPAADTTTGIVDYGSNPAAGKTFRHDGVTLYYETYGSGKPLLLAHGNGASIGSLGAQIAYFSRNYRVIAMDSRDHGKSGDSKDAITYEKMADDLAALLTHLKVGPAYVLGWSDGGVEALLLGIRHPAQVEKIAAMSANLNPSEEAFPPDVLAMIESMIEAIPDADTPETRRARKVAGMMLVEPHIDAKALEAIKAPTLVMAADHDLIRHEHTVEIYEHIPNAQLVIFPDATHMLPIDDPAPFNAAVERFFRTPYVKKNRIDDMLASLEKLRAAAASSP